VVCVAYLIKAHTDPLHMACLGSVLTGDLFVHVDAVVSIEPSLAEIRKR
jgi:hypothetical protein